MCYDLALETIQVIQWWLECNSSFRILCVAYNQRQCVNIKQAYFNDTCLVVAALGDLSSSCCADLCNFSIMLTLSVQHTRIKLKRTPGFYKYAKKRGKAPIWVECNFRPVILLYLWLIRAYINTHMRTGQGRVCRRVHTRSPKLQLTSLRKQVLGGYTLLLFTMWFNHDRELCHTALCEKGTVQTHFGIDRYCIDLIHKQFYWGRYKANIAWRDGHCH